MVMKKLTRHSFHWNGSVQRVTLKEANRHKWVDIYLHVCRMYLTSEINPVSNLRPNNAIFKGILTRKTTLYGFLFALLHIKAILKKGLL